MTNLFKKGEITIPLALAFSISTVIISGVSAYFIGQAAQAKEIGNISADTKVNSSKIDAMEKRFDRFEEKVDALLQRQGINPKLYEE